MDPRALSHDTQLPELDHTQTVGLEVWREEGRGTMSIEGVKEGVMEGGWESEERREGRRGEGDAEAMRGDTHVVVTSN